MLKKHYRIFADYHQIILSDGNSFDESREILWNDLDLYQMIVVRNHFLVIEARRNLTVDVYLEVHVDFTPNINGWDHLVECSIQIATGELRMFGTSDSIADGHSIRVPPGVYQVTVGYKGLGTVSMDGLTGNDSYHVFVSSTQEYRPLKIIKQGAPK